MGLRRLRQQSCHTPHFSGSSILAPAFYPFAFINRAWGSFHFAPVSLHLIFFLTLPDLWSSAATAATST